MKEGDILKTVGDELELKIHTKEVLGVCGSIVFTRNVNDDGSTSAPSFAEEEYLITLGWKVQPK